MQVRVQQQVLSPTVQDGEEPNLGSEVLRVGSDGGQSFGRLSEENAVDHFLVLGGDSGNLFGHGEYDMKVGHLEKLGLSVLNPTCPGKGLTFWAMAVAAAVETIPLVTALIAAFEMAPSAAVRHTSMADITRRCAVDIESPYFSR